MKIIIANADFRMNSVKYDFSELAPSRKATSSYLHKGDGVLTGGNANFEVNYYDLPVGTTAIRVTGGFNNSAAIGVYDSSDNFIDLIEPNVDIFTNGKYEFVNEVRQIVDGASYIGVTKVLAYENPIKVEYTKDSLESDEFNIGYFYENGYLNMSGVKTANNNFKRYIFNVEGVEKIKISGTFVNCTALAFYSDKALENLVAIGQNNGGVSEVYTLNGVVTDVPSGAKYAAASVDNSRFDQFVLLNKID